jgi:aminopeptidase
VPTHTQRHAELAGRLAELAVRVGANVQPGQLVGITTYTGKEYLAREIARVAYQAGAKYVDVVTFDQWTKRQRIAHAAEDTLDYVPPWIGKRLLWLSEEHAARITLSGPQAPKALDGLDPARTGRDILPYVKEVNPVVNARTTNWTIVPAPTPAWAEVVFPDLEPQAAYDNLWEQIAHVCRIDEPDPVAAWKEREIALHGAAERLNWRRFDAIRLHGPGTDLTVGLFPSSRWHAAGFETVDGVHHLPNVPTEETFTTPDPARVNGYATATMPLELYGSMIEGLRVEFEDGKAVKIDADRGAEALRAAASRDEGGSRLGELALVDGQGRIGPLGTVFYDTLLDENAASHIALGSSYDLAVEDEADKPRANRSGIHVDFMIGSLEIDVDGIDADGTVVPLLRAGVWQI